MRSATESTARGRCLTSSKSRPVLGQLSEEQVPYLLIERIHVATKLCTEATIPPFGQLKASGRGEISLPLHVSTSRSFCDFVCTRRSVLDFRGGGESVSLSQLATLLSTTKEPLFADFATPRFVHLYLYVHRVEGLAHGVYRYWPEHTELEKIKEGDQRLVAFLAPRPSSLVDEYFRRQGGKSVTSGSLTERPRQSAAESVLIQIRSATIHLLGRDSCSGLVCLQHGFGRGLAWCPWCPLTSEFGSTGLKRAMQAKRLNVRKATKHAGFR
jgi:hypothetical protein